MVLTEMSSKSAVWPLVSPVAIFSTTAISARVNPQILTNTAASSDLIGPFSDISTTRGIYLKRGSDAALRISTPGAGERI